MAYYSLGKQYYYEGKELPYFEKSVDDFTTSLQIDPSNPDSFTMRGWAYYWIGCYYDERIYLKNSTISDIIERGMNDCDNALKLDPNNVDALNCRALLAIHRVKGQFINKADPVLLEKAKNDIDTSLKINQTNPWTYFSLGYYYYLTSAPILSEEAFSEAISLDPDEAYFYLWRAKSRSTIDRYKAIEDNEKAIELQPRCALGYNNRAAQSSYVDEDFESRVTYFDKSIEIDPTNPLFYRNYAYSLWNLKYWDKQVQSQVIALFDKALELDPSFYVIHGDKALIYIYLNKNEESTQEILKFQIYAQTNEDFEYIQDILQYNGGQPWYYTHL
jgi:tetratricopeptide (TPR) repeat protein